MKHRILRASILKVWRFMKREYKHRIELISWSRKQMSGSPGAHFLEVYLLSFIILEDKIQKLLESKGEKVNRILSFIKLISYLEDQTSLFEWNKDWNTENLQMKHSKFSQLILREIKKENRKTNYKSRIQDKDSSDLRFSLQERE